MHNFRMILLGSAAGLVATTGLQAADLPVKAKPVEYVRVCNLYGVGFWYVPGTDTCMKIGSYIREQVEWNAGAGAAVIGLGANDQAAGGRMDRTDTSELSMRTRAAISLDLRTQTDYGTLRSYLQAGFETNAQNGSAPKNDEVYFNRGFIQFAGLTAGRIRSYYDVLTFSPYTYEKGSRLSGDDGSKGTWGIAYTVPFGGGFDATLSLEDGGSSSQGNSAGQNSSRGHTVTNLSMASQFGLGTTSYDNEGWKVPDIVGQLRLDRPWGYAQIAAAIHDASGGYYQTGSTTLGTGIQNNGHPGDKYGYAVIGGFHLSDVLGLRGDSVGLEADYTVGASGYATMANGPVQIYGAGNSAAFGWMTDGVFITGSAIELTTVWGINGYAQHFWNPQWRTSLYGGYIAVDYDAAATKMMCPAAGGVTAAVAMTAVSNCSPNFGWWQVGSRTQWNPHPDLSIGVDLLLTHVNTAFAGTATLAANGARPGGVYTIADQDIVTVMFRVQRSLLKEDD